MELVQIQIGHEVDLKATKFPNSEILVDGVEARVVARVQVGVKLGNFETQNGSILFILYK